MAHFCVWSLRPFRFLRDLRGRQRKIRCSPVGGCVLHIKPFILPVDIPHYQCPCRFINPKEIQTFMTAVLLWGQTILFWSGTAVLKGICGQKTTPQRYWSTLWYAVSRVDKCNVISWCWIRQAEHTHSTKRQRKRKKRTKNIYTYIYSRKTNTNQYKSKEKNEKEKNIMSCLPAGNVADTWKRHSSIITQININRVRLFRTKREITDKPEHEAPSR